MSSEGLLPHLTGKWTIQVITVLAQNAHPVRFGEIQKRIDGLSRRVLAMTLRTLERDGLVERHVFPDMPPRVEYRLTSTGAGFVPVLQISRAGCAEPGRRYWKHVGPSMTRTTHGMEMSL